MGNNNHTEYRVRRVGKGYRRFNGEQYFFLYKAVMTGSFADNGCAKHEQEVKDKVEMLKSQGYKVRVVQNSRAEYLFYTAGERTN